MKRPVQSAGAEPARRRHDNDTNTERGSRPGQYPVVHNTGATAPGEPDSGIYDDPNIPGYTIILIRMMMKTVHGRSRPGRLIGRGCVWV